MVHKNAVPKLKRTYSLSEDLVKAIANLVAERMATEGRASAYGLESEVVEEYMRKATGMPQLLKKEGVADEEGV